MFSSNSFAEWFKLSDVDCCFSYIDIDDIKVNGNKIYWFQKSVFKNQTGSIIDYIEGNCDLKSTKIIQRSYFKDSSAKELIDVVIKNETVFQRKGTFGYQNLEFACGIPKIFN